MSSIIKFFRDTTRVSERLKTYDLWKLGNIGKLSKLGEGRAHFSLNKYILVKATRNYAKKDVKIFLSFSVLLDFLTFFQTFFPELYFLFSKKFLQGDMPCITIF